MHWRTRVFGVVTVLLVTVGLATTTAAAAGGHTILVKPGGSI